jgi:hypothetical protein
MCVPPAEPSSVIPGLLSSSTSMDDEQAATPLGAFPRAAVEIGSPPSNNSHMPADMPPSKQSEVLISPLGTLQMEEEGAGSLTSAGSCALPSLVAEDTPVPCPIAADMGDMDGKTLFPIAITLIWLLSA